MNLAGIKQLVVTGVLLIGGFASAADVQRETGLEQLMNLENIPCLRTDVQVHYEGSIDKKGGNADWDWWLYQDTNTQEWVIMEADGSGCLWNFVVHHAVGHSDPVYRFYFDGDRKPAFEIKHSEFGSKAPFISPLADKFLPLVSKDKRLKAIDFQIVRSFCPMPFKGALKITSSIQLRGNHTTGGGWGHAIWHSYPTTEGVRTFTGKEDIEPLLKLWRNVGQDPKPVSGNERTGFQKRLAPNEAAVVFDKSGEGSLTAIHMQQKDLRGPGPTNMWIKITWDGESRPAVECPVGSFFGNEFGKHTIQTLMQGASTNGVMYNYWPMPFWKSARVELENRGDKEVAVEGTVEFKSSGIKAYPRERTGHFRASAYQPRTPRPLNRDALVAEIAGSGHVVAGFVTRTASMCEGDVRVLIDGLRTPSIESDGSESWACYGWGFEFPPQCNPASSYDGAGNGAWSMLRLLMGDCYPFRHSLHMTVEGGDGYRDSRRVDNQSGIVFWYGETAPAMVMTDELVIGDVASEAKHGYESRIALATNIVSSFEGEFDNVSLTGTVRRLSGLSRFTVKLASDNQGVILRRMSDQALGGQKAMVFIDGKQVTERNWICPDRNPNFRWLEDEYLVPAEYTAGKKEVAVRIEPVQVDGKGAPVWNEGRYMIFSLAPGAKGK